MTEFSFDATAVKPNYGGGGGWVPQLKGRAMIVKTAIEPVKDNPQLGKVVLTLRGLDGPNNGIETNDNLNIYHSNPVTSRIATEQMSAYCHVTGQYRLANTDQLCNIPFMYDCALQKGENPKGYTEITKLYDVNGNEPGKTGQQHNAGAQAPPPPPQTAPPQGFAATGQAPPMGQGGYQVEPAGQAQPQQGWGAPPPGAPIGGPPPGPPAGYAAPPPPGQYNTAPPAGYAAPPAPQPAPQQPPGQAQGGWSPPGQGAPAAQPPGQGGWNNPGVGGGGAAPPWGAPPQ